MSRQSGYTVTIKAFVPSPKDDFDKQAAAAVLMATITKSKTIPPEFLELATIDEVRASYGSRLATVVAETQGSTDPATGLPDGTAQKAARGRPATAA